MEESTKKYTKIGIVIFIILLVLIVLCNSFKSVPTGYVGVRTRFGKVQETVIQEGLNVKIPFVEKIVLIDCRTKKIDVTAASSTKDLQNVSSTISLNYNVNKDTANALYRQVGVDYEDIIISPAIQESIKSTMAQYTAEELITKRAEVSAMILDALMGKIADDGFTVTEFNITDIDFSDAFDAAIEAKAVKQQEVVTAQAELEKQKIENEKEIAEAEKDAKVMELQNEQITENTLKLKELEVKEKLIEKWSGNFPSTMLSDDVNALFNIGQ
jgi:regulator of protease activity HflC (stomatin/prohibitin superfamily)